MIKFFFLFFILFLVLFSAPCLYAGIVVYEKDEGVTVKVNERRENFVLPNELKNASRFSIIIPQKEEDKKKEGKDDLERDPASFQKMPKPDLATLLMQANHFYHKKEYKKLLSVLNKAEKFYPKAHRVKTMKGSLFYSLGWKDLAEQQWKSSLDLEPNQPSVRKYMDRIGSFKTERIPSSESEPFDSTEIKESIEDLKEEVKKEVKEAKTVRENKEENGEGEIFL